MKIMTRKKMEKGKHIDFKDKLYTKQSNSMDLSNFKKEFKISFSTKPKLRTTIKKKKMIDYNLS